MNLALKYRPKTFNDMVAQEEIIDILTYQVNNKSTKNSYLSVGASGCGKTTAARILADMLNNGKGSPIEIDAASNNGVDNIRSIIEQANFRSIISEYKIYIIDECHMLSNGAWNALLKLLEEPPMKTVFILCTTEPQKVIPTVLSRVQRFDFTKIPDTKIIERLKYIYEKEVSNAQYDNKSFEIIAKNSQGGLRTAISLLDKCLDFSPNLIVNNVYMALNLISEDNLSNVVDYIFNKKEEELLKELDVLYNNSYDFKVFIKDLIKFSLEKYKENIINENRIKYLGLINCLLNINNEIKYDNDPKTIVECELLLFIKNI